MMEVCPQREDGDKIMSKNLIPKYPKHFGSLIMDPATAVNILAVTLTITI